jgi:hypothetical protein
MKIRQLFNFLYHPKMDPIKTGCGDVNRTEFAKDHSKWQTLVLLQVLPTDSENGDLNISVFQTSYIITDHTQSEQNNGNT